MSLSRRLMVLHVDHTVESGGAELALLRLLSANRQWQAALAIPHHPTLKLGVFKSIDERSPTSVRALSPAIPAGATRGGLRRSIGYLIKDVIWAIRLRTSRDFRQADVIHANTTHASLLAALACLTSRKTLVVSVRDQISQEALGSIGLKVFRSVVMRRANGYIANSAYTLSTLRLCHRGHLVATSMPSPTGVEKIQPGNARTAPEVSTIGMLARIDSWKGQDVLIRAFAEEFKGSEVKLVLAGAAAFGQVEHQTQLVRLARELGVEGQVEFLGHVEQVENFIDSMDICVQASTRPEPLGQNVLQYLARGRPTVVTSSGGPPEWVIHGVNGLHHRAGDVHDLAGSLRQLADDESLRLRLSDAARSTPGLASDVEVAQRHYDVFYATAASRRLPQKADVNGGVNGDVTTL